MPRGGALRQRRQIGRETPQGITIDASQVESQASDVDLVKRRRSQIVDAAVSLFAREGFYRTTVQQVAQKANISAGLIYHYARTKEDVLLLALLHVLDTYSAEIPRALRDVKDPMRQLYTVLAAFCRIVANNLDATVLVYRSTKSLPPAQRELVKRSEMEANQFFADALRACIAAKLFRPVEVEIATYQIVMSVHMWALKHWHFKAQFDIEQYISSCFDYHIHALATAAGLRHYRRHFQEEAAKASEPVERTAKTPSRKARLTRDGKRIAARGL